MGGGQWGGMSHPVNPAGGVSLSRSLSLVSTVQSRHHLASWNATEQGVEGLKGSLQGGDGSLWLGDGVLNSSGVNHVMPTKAF